MHEDVKQILAKTQQSATLPSSETVVQQMPLKPAVFYGRDVIIEEITQLLIKEETSRVCILGAGGMGKTSVSLGVVEQPIIKARFLPNCGCLEILGSQPSRRSFLYSLPRHSPV